MREGSLEAPVRHKIDWRNPDFYDMAKIEAEMHRVFDICHGCRRCFNLCDSFPRLFDLVDASPDEMAGVDTKDYKQVVDACTLCDLCFMTKCPYVPPHEWALDFPHLMLRYRAAELKQGKNDKVYRQLTETDRNGKMAALAAPIANAVAESSAARQVMEAVTGIDARAHVPKFNGRTLVLRAMENRPEVNREAPAFGRKAVIYATCFANYNNPEIGMAAINVLAKNGVETEVVYPRCCGMPQLEQGDVARVADHAADVADALLPYVDAGYDVIALVPSCALMLKFEWPLILPEEDKVKRLAQATFDISEYVVDIAKRNGLAPGLQPLEGGVALHIACHSRAQNMGQKATEMLKLIPQADLAVIERCSGHGGAWGVMKGNFDVALKVGKPVARQAMKAEKAHIASECPLAGAHIQQGIDALRNDQSGSAEAPHPIQLFARAYGLA
ncbi:glycerol-3-phosphate dehydrogenase subunit C [Dongia mobilis]|uniref:Glycerol-3-phosphate dehydrogenase subunit C n=1 Tax=Dongia mobilis TaxID=578943 RepID=A0A4R6X2P4_9PROT|nr:heterodisulfide reductase-related iron-sulfur binding cluster [Dongia mobilis]TDQ86362.1 glycerol-3-phosphate dehydrogenase subunit C [Dongia mobilis]